MPFSRRSFPTWGPTFSAERSVKGPATVFALSHSATAGETPGVFAASSTDAKRPFSERAAMIACASRPYSTFGSALGRVASFSGSSAISFARSDVARRSGSGRTPSASAPFGKRAFVSAVVTSFERSRPSFFSSGTRRRTSFFSGLSKRWTETTLTFAASTILRIWSSSGVFENP